MPLLLFAVSSHGVEVDYHSQTEGTVLCQRSATVRESCSSSTNVLLDLSSLPRCCPTSFHCGSLGDPDCLTLSAFTSYDGKLPSAGVAQWQSEGLIIPRPWVRFPPPAPIEDLPRSCVFRLPASPSGAFDNLRHRAVLVHVRLRVDSRRASLYT